MNSYDWTRPPQIRLSLDDELLVDSFAGGGGASMGIEQATGRHVDIAINHSSRALAMHEANHPLTQHFCEDIFHVDPVKVCKGRPVGFAWFSPDCKHHSKARGGKPRDKKIRALAWVAIKWAALVRPRVFSLENVEEWKEWGPLTDNNQPCPINKGRTFRAFIKVLTTGLPKHHPDFKEIKDFIGHNIKDSVLIKGLGYKVESKELRACDYGAPTTRKRLFLIARCDGKPIVWPEVTHGEEGGLKSYLTAADCIDWSIPCPSIFLNKEAARKYGARRPLAEKTLKRIGKGLRRYVLDADNPFVVPFITEHANGTSQRNMAINEPLRTICAQVKGGHFALVSAFLKKYSDVQTDNQVHLPNPSFSFHDIELLSTSHLVKLRGTCKDGQSVLQPVPTITAGGTHLGEVRAFLIKYYGTDQDPQLTQPLHTVTTKPRFGLVTIKGEDYQIIDIGMRMLKPRELYRAQGFPDFYIIAPIFNGKPLTIEAQVHMVGNSVSPPLARAIVEANYNVEHKEGLQPQKQIG